MSATEIQQIQADLRNLREEVLALRLELARYRSFIGGAWWVLGTLAVGAAFIINLLFKH